jgi:hypothetical protein
MSPTRHRAPTPAGQQPGWSSPATIRCVRRRQHGQGAGCGRRVRGPPQGRGRVRQRQLLEHRLAALAAVVARHDRGKGRSLGTDEGRALRTASRPRTRPEPGRGGRPAQLPAGSGASAGTRGSPVALELRTTGRFRCHAKGGSAGRTCTARPGLTNPRLRRLADQHARSPGPSSGRGDPVSAARCARARHPHPRCRFARVAAEPPQPPRRKVT